jgi:hypothetical protein
LRLRRHREPPHVVALIRAADEVKELFPDPAWLNDDDDDAGFDADELHDTVIGGLWEHRLTEEARDLARELALSLAAREATTAEQHAALSRLLELLTER